MSSSTPAAVLSALHTTPFIDGNFVAPFESHLQDSQKNNAHYDVINPATEEVIASVAMGGPADIDAAVAAAKRAFHGEWSLWEPQRRQDALFRLGLRIQEKANDIGLVETLQTGKTLFDSCKVEIPLTGEIFKYFAGWATKITGSTLPSSPTSFKFTMRQPIGVCGLIVPWNFPLLLTAWKVAPALAMGNTVVLKPAEQTPLTALMLASLCKEVGIPDGVINVVTGYGPSAGQHLVEHPDVNKIAFTGSVAVGKKVQAAAAATLKRVSLELGGKSPNIIFADADIKAALRGAVGGIFYNKGEVCAAGSRLFVEKAVYADVVKHLQDVLGKYTLGDPREKTTRMGPVVSQVQMERVLQYIEQGRSEGATLSAGGRRALHVNDGKGFFVEPTLFTDVDNQMRIAQEEIFGPVLAVIPFDGEQEATKLANDVRYGLAAGIWTKDIKKALRLARNIEAGTVWVNAYNLYDAALPFGGFKDSGFGRDLGEAALEQYTESKSVWVDLT